MIVLRALPIVLSLAGSLAAFSGAARAQDDEPSYTMEDVTACSADAMRLCQNEMPDVKAIQSCMSAKFDRLSAKCQARFKR